MRQKEVDVVKFKESVSLLKKFKIPLAPSHLVKTLHEAKTVALGFGFPVVAKLISVKHVHKTDTGAVITNIKNPKALQTAYNKLIALDQHPEGILIQPQLRGVELFAGLHYDSVFGAVIGFGLGGVLVEATKDVHFAICPPTKRDLDRIISKSQIAPLLDGYRGQQLIPRSEVHKVLTRLATIAKEFPDLSIDLNPLFIMNKKLVAADWRVLHV